MSKKQVQNRVKKESLLKDIIALFFDTSNRPKKTPLHLSVIQRRLEEKFQPWQVNDALNKLINKKILSSHESSTNSIRRVRFFYPSIFDKNIKHKNHIFKKIKRNCDWLEKYSNQRITRILGKHLHSLVKSELRIQGFTIVKEGRVRSYKDNNWTETNHDLDIIAEHKQKKIAVGIEIKNTIDVISKKEITTKIRMCQKLGIIPVFACRWLKPYAEEIWQNNGFPWQFNVQMYPLGMEELVEKIQKRFGFKIQVRTELPLHSTTELKKWLIQH